VHHRTTIPSEEARAVVVALLASGRVPPVQPTRLGIQRPGARPALKRFWGIVCQRDETIYLILFLNDRCLVLALSRCPRAAIGPVRERVRSRGGVRRAWAFGRHHPLGGVHHVPGEQPDKKQSGRFR